MSSTQTFNCLNCGTRIGPFSVFCTEACKATALRDRRPETGADLRAGKTPGALQRTLTRWLIEEAERHR